MSALTQRDRFAQAGLLRLLARGPGGHRTPDGLRELADALELDHDGDLVKLGQIAVSKLRDPVGS